MGYVISDFEYQWIADNIGRLLPSQMLRILNRIRKKEKRKELTDTQIDDAISNVKARPKHRPKVRPLMDIKLFRMLYRSDMVPRRD